MKIPRWLVITFLIAAIVGFADSAYLTAQHVRGSIPPCDTARNCETVLASAYAVVGPIPVAAFGLAYYGLLIVLLIAYFDSHDRRMLHLASWLTGAGLLASLYFVLVQVVILKALCPYCLVSTAMTVLMFGIAVRIMYTD
jgi:uncharacterized membrane protein